MKDEKGNVTKPPPDHDLRRPQPNRIRNQHTSDRRVSGDYPVINATCQNTFAGFEEDARQIADKLGDCPPAMAIAQYREAQAVAARTQRDLAEQRAINLNRCDFVP